MNDPKVKQQIVDKIKASTSILVAVSNSPSVDALSAALGLTMLLNQLEKHATAVFSGAIPPAISFLDPAKTFENTADSLRDFIIALNKEKADHLRYKVDGDVVKIFITPYRTTITSDDLEFTQGDYNVELVLALGVESQDHLDTALEAHGKILHDATVVTISAGDQKSDLGSIDWQDPQASSLSEMIVSLSDSLKTDTPILDAQTATAFLTGIVAATDRFSNTKTTSKVMTMAAQLMAAGADQQLIASKLQESHEINETQISSEYKVQDVPPASQHDASSLAISHEGQTLEEIANEVAAEHQQEAADEAEKDLAKDEHSDLPTPAPEATPPVEETVTPEPVDEPPLAPPDPYSGTLSSAYALSPEDETSEDATSPVAPAASGATLTTPADTLSRDHDEARAAVESALESTQPPVMPPISPFDLPPPPPLPDFSSLPPAPLTSAYALEPETATTPPTRLGDILAPEAPTPPIEPSIPPMPPASDNPAQFKIPGQ